MKNVMIDLETMGNRPDAAIVAIGAVEFDLETKTLGQEFYVVVDLESAISAGGTVSASTILWWIQQSEEARAEINKPGLDIALALKNLTYFLTGQFSSFVVSDKCVWGNGAAFDNVILRSAYERLGFRPPWGFWNDRCYRTIRETSPQIEFKKEGVWHKALDDAKNQARYLMEVMG